jgi:hypothetical protein
MISHFILIFIIKNFNDIYLIHEYDAESSFLF